MTPDEVANTFAEVLGRRVSMDAVPRETWEQLFRSQGMKNPTPRIRMLDGFNEGWIEFENGAAGSRKGEVTQIRAANAGRTRRHPANPSGRACQPQLRDAHPVEGLAHYR